MVEKKETALVRTIQVRPDDFGGAFFKNAYQAARGGDDSQKEADAEIIRGAILQIADSFNFDLNLPEGVQAAATALGAYLSLGLAEASKEDMYEAVSLLQNKPFELVIQLGMALHSEIKEKAKNLLFRNVIVLDIGHYGILDPEHEKEIAHICDQATLFNKRETYTTAKERLDYYENILMLSKQFPIGRVMGNYGSLYRYYQQAFKRPNRNTPCNNGGLLSLFLCSYVMRALVCPPFHSDNYYNAKDLRDLIKFYFETPRDQMKRTIEDTFFDPKEVAEKVPGALKEMQRYFQAELSIFHDRGVVRKKRIAKNLLPVAEQLAKNVITRFVQSVRDYFKTADNVDVGEKQLHQYWASWVFVDAYHKNLAKDTASQNIEMVLKVPPEELKDYLKDAEHWTAEQRQLVIDKYPWESIIFKINDEDQIGLWRTACDKLGPEVLMKTLHKRNHLSLWLKAWKEDSPNLREGILDLLKVQIGSEGRIGMRKVLDSLGPGFTRFNGDIRLLEFLISVVLRSSHSPYVEKGMSIQSWGKMLSKLFQEPAAVKTVFNVIPAKHRNRKLFDTIPDNIADSICKIIGW